MIIQELKVPIIILEIIIMEIPRLLPSKLDFDFSMNLSFELLGFFFSGKKIPKTNAPLSLNSFLDLDAKTCDFWCPGIASVKKTGSFSCCNCHKPIIDAMDFLDDEPICKECLKYI